MTADQNRCARFDAVGGWLGWCGVRHRYQDRARTHVRVLNRSWANDENPRPWRLVSEASLATLMSEALRIDRAIVRREAPEFGTSK